MLKNPYIAGIALVVFTLALYFGITLTRHNAPSLKQELSALKNVSVPGLGYFYDSPVTDGRKAFAVNQYGISFTYPSDYFAFAATSTNPGKTETYGIGLLQDSPALREALAGAHNEAGMIPRISILIYHQNDSDSSLEELARQQIVNANGEDAPIPHFSKTTVGGLPALRYIDASGLYARDTVLVRNGEWVVRISADDPTHFKTDLDSILSSINFDDMSNDAETPLVSVGDLLGAMTVVSVAPYNTGQHSTDPKMMKIGPRNIKITLKGPIEITGAYSHAHSAIGFDGYCMSITDPASLARLPVVPVNGVRPNVSSSVFCFRNEAAARQQLGEESRTVTVEIDNFELNAYPAEVMDWADLIDVIKE